MSQGHWQAGGMETAVEYSAEEQIEYAQVNEAGDDVVVSDGDGPVRKRKPWERVGPDGKLIKRKPNLARKNMLLRKNLTPKNSVMCLNELKPGLKFVTDRVATVGNYSVSVEVNGHTFNGFGSTKDQAKQAAAEAALMSFVKPPPPKPPAGEAPKPEDDTTPWKTLASFAMYKLFTDWRDSKFGPGPHCFPHGMPAMGGALMGAPQAPVPKEDMLESFQNINAHLNRTSGSIVMASNASTEGDSDQAGADGVMNVDPVESNALKPIRQAKMNPEHQSTRHPVMILHQMCPQIMYTAVEKQDETGAKIFDVSAEINGQTFTGQGSAVKKAKLGLAKSALKQLYGIDNIYPCP